MEPEKRIAQLRRELEDTLARAEGLQKSVRYLEEGVSKLQARLDGLETEGTGAARGKLLDEIGSEVDSVASARKELSAAVQTAEKLREELRRAESKVMEFGWQVADMRDSQRDVAVPGGSELEALQIISEAGEDAKVGTLRMRMGLSNAYARMVCNSLGRRDFIDVAPDGTCRLTTKGEKAITKVNDTSSV